MKKISFIIFSALFLCGLFGSGINVLAQPAITPLDPYYVNGVEKFIGSLVPETKEVRLFPDVGFTVPYGCRFAPNSFQLTVGKHYSIPNFSIVDDDTLLFVTVQFGPLFGSDTGDFLDTLTIQVNGITDNFVLPIRGSSVDFEVSPNGILMEPALPGDTVQGSVTVTTINQRLDGFSFRLLSGAPFSIAGTVQNPNIPISTIEVFVQFIAPPAVGAVYEDSLIITYNSSPGLSYSLPVKASVEGIKVNPPELDFGRVNIGESRTLDLEVRSVVYIDTVFIEDNPRFTFVKSGNWNPNTGGTLSVTYTPDANYPYEYAYMDLVSGSNTLYVLLTGVGAPKPEITVDPSQYDFGGVPVGKIVFSDVLTAVLTNPDGSLLTDPGAITINDPDKVFFIEKIEPGEYTTNPDTAYITVSFTPIEVGESYLATLTVSANNAEPKTIRLIGEGVEPSPLLSPSDATAISRVETAPPALSVREGAIVVSGAPVGSTVRVYNLNGQLLKTQAVASDVELLETDAFPLSACIVLVTDRKKVILYRKVIR